MEGEKPPDSGWLRRVARLFGVASGDADDVAQNTLARWWASRAGVDPARLEAWLYRVAQNEALAVRRREQARREVLMPIEEVAGVAGRTEVDPETAAIRAADLAVAREMVQSIHPSRRIIYLEHHVCDMTAAEIAAAHRIPVETVRTRLKLAAADIKAARARRDAAKRGRFAAFILPFLGARPRWARRGLGAWSDSATRVAAFVCSAAVVAALLVAISRWPPRLPPGPPLLRLPAARLAAPVLGGMDAPPTAAPAVDSIAPPRVVHPSRPVAPQGASPHEKSLIRRARAAMEGGDPAFARSLLADHARQFPRGHLAGEREALLRLILN